MTGFPEVMIWQEQLLPLCLAQRKLRRFFLDMKPNFQILVLHFVYKDKGLIR